jgi:hypothetical protein
MSLDAKLLGGVRVTVSQLEGKSIGMPLKSNGQNHGSLSFTVDFR